MEQTVAVKADTHYRVEAVVTCLVGANDEGAGVVLSVRPESGGPSDTESTPPIHAATEPTTIRAYHRTGRGVTKLRIGIGIRGAPGWAEVTSVRLLEIIEPEHVSHVVAAPPPPWRLAQPLTARSITVCTEEAERGVVTLLRQALGRDNVRVAGLADPGSTVDDAQALLIPDAAAPGFIRSLAALVRLASDRTVIISTRAFARLAKLDPSLRTVKQEDDPIHAEVALGGWPTRGFALNDAFAYAWSGGQPDGFVQRQFKRSGSVKRVCDRHGLHTLLRALCNQDATSGRPIAFHRSTERGALFVLDIEPVEEPPSTYGEPSLAMYLLLNLLGHRQCHVGQYIVPHRTDTEFRTSIRDMADRLAPWVVHDEDVPIEDVTHQMVTVGSDDATFGLPLKPKPVILVRSGLAGGEVESVYAAYLWFKQLVRTPPDECPYGAALGSRFRLAWVPLSSDWEACEGWARHGRPPVVPTSIESDGSKVAAVIDLVSRPFNRVRVVLPERHGRYSRYFELLPLIAAGFGPPPVFTFDAAPGAAFADRRSFDWRWARTPLEVVVDDEPPAPTRPALAGAGVAPGLAPGVARRSAEEAMGCEGPSSAHHAGPATQRADFVRIELPARAFDLPAHSIRVMDVGVSVLEWVIGVQVGAMAVNRRDVSIEWSGRCVEPGRVVFDGRAAAAAPVQARVASAPSAGPPVQAPA